MALELPDWLTAAFNLIGLPWPGIDEDQLRAWAASVRQFADDIGDSSSRVNQTMNELASSSKSSVIGAVAEQYEGHHRLLVELRGPMDDFAQGLDAAADAVVAQKWVVIGAAGALAAEFTGTQIGAIFTLGADEAALPAEIISTRAIVKLALQDLTGVLLGKLINVAAQDVSDHVSRFVGTLLSDALSVAMEAQSLTIAYGAVRDAARQIRGHAAETEEIGNRAHAENVGRDIEDHSGGGGWSEVINALRQGLLDIAGDLFRQLPATIARTLRDIAETLEKFAARLKVADAGGSVGRSGGPGGPGGVFPGGQEPEPPFEPPKITVNRHGQLTNGRYTLDSPGMDPHLNYTPGKSQFRFYVNSGKAVLDGAAYADKHDLWVGSKAKVPTDGIIGYLGNGTPTSWINIYRSPRSGVVHGCPGSPP